MAAHKAIIAIGMRARRQVLIMGCGDTAWVKGASLALAAAVILLHRHAPTG